MPTTTSLKLPEDVKRLDAAAAQGQGVTTHAFMVEAIRLAAGAAAQRAEFIAEAQAARAEVLQNGKAYAAADVHAYLRARRGEKGRQTEGQDLAQLIYSSRAIPDLERLTDLLREALPASAVETVDLITEAVEILANHPLIVRPAEEGLRELLISRGRTGHVALYSFEVHDDTVLILAVRHQRESGYRPDQLP